MEGEGAKSRGRAAAVWGAVEVSMLVLTLWTVLRSTRTSHVTRHTSPAAREEARDKVAELLRAASVPVALESGRRALPTRLQPPHFSSVWRVVMQCSLQFTQCSTSNVISLLASKCYTKSA